MKTVLFCHGVPGSPADGTLLSAANPDVEVIAVDLLGFGPGSVGLALSQALDRAAPAKDQDGIAVAGFSIGAMAAIRLAADYPDLVSRLILVSPAAPLSLGDFLPDMAGRPVFGLATDHPARLHALTVFQGAMTRWFPDAVIALLFRTCGPAERALLKEPGFRAALVAGLDASFRRNRANYLAYLRAYVADWTHRLALVRCPVDIWHGTQDTWSPPQMSTALAESFGNSATLKLVEGAGHYSTLTHVTL